MFKSIKLAYGHLLLSLSDYMSGPMNVKAWDLLMENYSEEQFVDFVREYTAVDYDPPETEWPLQPYTKAFNYDPETAELTYPDDGKHFGMLDGTPLLDTLTPNNEPLEN